jgi:hypothetical protein
MVPTFAVNIAAAFLLGYFVTRLQERLPLSSYRRPLLGTGLLSAPSVPRCRWMAHASTVRPAGAGSRLWDP